MESGGGDRSRLQDVLEYVLQERVAVPAGASDEAACAAATELLESRFLKVCALPAHACSGAQQRRAAFKLP